MWKRFWDDPRVRDADQNQPVLAAGDLTRAPWDLLVVLMLQVKDGYRHARDPERLAKRFDAFVEHARHRLDRPAQ